VPGPASRCHGSAKRRLPGSRLTPRRHRRGRRARRGWRLAQYAPGVPVPREWLQPGPDLPVRRGLEEPRRLRGLHQREPEGPAQGGDDQRVGRPHAPGCRGDHDVRQHRPGPAASRRWRRLRERRRARVPRQGPPSRPGSPHQLVTTGPAGGARRPRPVPVTARRGRSRAAATPPDS